MESNDFFERPNVRRIPETQTTVVPHISVTRCGSPREERVCWWRYHLGRWTITTLGWLQDSRNHTFGEHMPM